jgi:hypothetical protein
MEVRLHPPDSMAGDVPEIWRFVELIAHVTLEDLNRERSNIKLAASRAVEHDHPRSLVIIVQQLGSAYPTR